MYNTTRHDEYDVDEDGGEVDAGSVDDSKMRGVHWSRVDMMKVEEKSGELTACAVIFSKPSCGKRARLYESAGAS